MSAELVFESAEKLGTAIRVAAHPQIAVSPGSKPNTAVINTPDGHRHCVVGDYRDVEVKLQAAAAQAHESGVATSPNRPVS